MSIVKYLDIVVVNIPFAQRTLTITNQTSTLYLILCICMHDTYDLELIMSQAVTKKYTRVKAFVWARPQSRH